jgi:MoaA/NifB/PqqE/SkfB family radical SAM enzyme
MHIEASGNVKPCCSAVDSAIVGNLHNSSTSQILNSTPFKDIRKAMLRDVKHPACRRCYNSESKGELSLREKSNEKYSTIINEKKNQTLSDGSIVNFTLKSLDIRFSNLCNFKCRTCNADSSTSWYQETNYLAGYELYKNILKPKKTREELWLELDSLIPALDSAYILGGEPFLENDQYEFLDRLILHKKFDINLSYSTNLSHLSLGEKSVLRYLEKFKNVTLLLSYDGVGKKGELIRKGMSWENTLRNHRIIQNNESKIKFFISPIVSVLNVFHIIELIKYLIEEKMIKSGEQLALTILDQPDYYNIKILNIKERSELEKLYRHFIDVESKQVNLPNLALIILQLENILNFISKDDDQSGNYAEERIKFVIHNMKLDKMRKENLLKHFPELRELFLATVGLI